MSALPASNAQPVDRATDARTVLRNVVGKHDFFAIMRSWVRERRFGHGTTHQFRLLAEQMSGREFKHFFKVWLFTGHRPAKTAQNGWPQ